MRKIWIQKAGASTLLALFIFIHVIKTFHTHDFSLSSQQEKFNKSANIVSHSIFCSICDFQLAKDSDAIISSIHIKTPVTLISIRYNYLLPVATSFAIASDNKGPPFIA